MIKEIYESWQHRELWFVMAWRDIQQRYRRSVLGPFWITVSVGAVGYIIGLLYSTILKQDPAQYIPYLILGFLCWNLISSLITEGCQAFTANAVSIKEIPAPKLIYAYRVICRNLISLGYSIFTYLFLVFYFQTWPNFHSLLFIPGLLLIVINGLWVCLLLGQISARFSDIGPAIQNTLRIIFFITPVIWRPEHAGSRGEWVYINPFYYFIEIMRSPLLGIAPSLNIWMVVLVITILGWSVTAFIYSRFGWRIPYWV